MKNRLISKIKKILNQLVGDKFKARFVSIVLPIVFSLVALIMTIINIIKDVFPLGYATGGFFVVCVVITFLNIFFKKTEPVCRIVFMVSIIVLFSYFLYSGGTGDGFSNYWIIILPTCSFFAFGLLRGSIVSGTMLTVVVALLWTPLKDVLEIQYLIDDPVFCLRFPIVYIAAMIVAFLLEELRHVTAVELAKVSEKHRLASITDSLTGLHNQQWFFNYIYKDAGEFKIGEEVGCLFMDINKFKNLNDTYGHLFGNVVLEKVGAILKEAFPESACRFGGDEFVVIERGLSKNELFELAYRISNKIKKLEFEEHRNVKVSVSIGVAYTVVDDSFALKQILEKADYETYDAKRSHKADSIYGVEFPE